MIGALQIIEDDNKNLRESLNKFHTNSKVKNEKGFLKNNPLSVCTSNVYLHIFTLILKLYSIFNILLFALFVLKTSVNSKRAQRAMERAKQRRSEGEDSSQALITKKMKKLNQI